MRSVSFTMTRQGIRWRTILPLWFAAILLLATSLLAEESFEPRMWTDRKGNQLTSTFVDAKNGEVQFKNDAGEIQKFKLADFAEPDQKYLRDLAAYRRKQAAGEKPELPSDPAKASLDIQPWQSITEPVADMPPYRKPLLEFPVRIWTDTTGKKVQGKFVTAYNDKVVLDVKGTVFDLAVTRLSPDDQQYVAVQLRGLQRDDLVNVLAKAAATGQQQPGTAPTPAATPPATTVAGNAPAPAGPLGTDDIRARLEQLKAQREGNAEPGTQVAANTPPSQPLTNDDIKARLAQIRQQKGEPEPEFVPATNPGSPSVPSHHTSIEQTMQQQRERMERQRQESQERMDRIAAETQARLEAQRQAVNDSYSSSGSSQAYSKQCSKCRRVLPSHIGAGDRCPGCGITFDYDETTGSYTVGYRIGQVLGVLIMIGLVIGGIKKLFG